jgi:site-specific DNA-methyltransferase (adenine-specific)
MKQMPDNAFDLAIVDPPYGIGYDVACAKNNGKKFGGNTKAKRNTYHSSGWDNQIPDAVYFSELKRVSKNQIIWGWNYFVAHLNDCPSYIVWNKKTNGNFADCESAWCSKRDPARVFEYLWNGMLQQDMKNKEVRIHPTQKPVKLYEWLLTNYAKEGDKILDTHLGSGSIAIACHNLKFDLVGYELDSDYFNAATERLEKHKRQLQLF